MSDFTHFLVYTTEEGGPLRTLWTTEEKFAEARASGRLNFAPHKDEPEWVDLKMVALARVEDLRDFVLDPLEVTP